MSYDEHLISMAGWDGEADVLGEIEARAQAATEGPWEPEPTRAGDYMPYYGVKSLAKGWNVVHARVDWEGFGHGSRQADAEFIAHAREDIPALLAMVREQRARLDAATAILDEWASYKPFPDADDDQRWYSLGKGHAADAVRAAITRDAS